MRQPDGRTVRVGVRVRSSRGRRAGSSVAVMTPAIRPRARASREAAKTKRSPVSTSRSNHLCRIVRAQGNNFVTLSRPAAAYPECVGLACINERPRIFSSRRLVNTYRLFISRRMMGSASSKVPAMTFPLLRPTHVHHSKKRSGLGSTYRSYPFALASTSQMWLL
jgi:hypothetical protein